MYFFSKLTATISFGSCRHLLLSSLPKSPICQRLLPSTHCIIFNRNGSIRKGEVEVYSAPLAKQVKGVKLFSLITSISGIFAQPVILERANELGASTATIIGLCSFVGFFTFVTPLLLHVITRKYVTSVVYDSNTDSYIATTYSILATKKFLTFRPGEAIIPDIPGMFTSITIKGRPLFLDVRFFDDTSHYKRIMGYDKPMDFKLNSEASKTMKN